MLVRATLQRMYARLPAQGGVLLVDASDGVVHSVDVDGAKSHECASFGHYLEQFRDRVLSKKLEWCEGEWVSLA